MDILMLLTGFQLLSLSEAFSLSCPSQAHWKLRAKSTCKPAKNYTCLYNVTFQVNVYREICRRPRIIAEGYRWVFQPNLNRATCRLNRYQPFIFNTIGNSDCIFLKSFCKSEGQTRYENGNTTSDRTCICNTKKGYTFVKNEGNQSYCNPSREDCSCYVGIHPNNGTVELTDFNCYGEMNSNGSCSQGDALNKSQAFKNHEFDNFNYNLALPTNEYRTKTIMCVLISLFSYLHVVGIYILQRMKIQKTNSNQETKSQHTEPKTEKITPIALPEVITRLKDEDKDTYIKLMQSEKQERRYFVRIMIVGREKTGKTCLMRRLIKESIDDVTSTDGLDIVVRKCKINIHDGSWKIKANIYDDKIDRLQRAIIQSENVEKESSMSDENMKNTYGSTQFSENIPKQRTTSKPGDKVPIIDNKSVDETGEQNINHHANMSTSNNIENVIRGNVNDNENSTIADKNGILKVNEDTDISALLVMPKDLMSSVLSTTSNSDISTNNHALCGLWDFAGQKEFYATHQAFLTSNAIYLLVANIADDISQKAVKQYFADFDKVGDYVDFWFDTIHCHQTVNPGGYVSCNEYRDPPVIVVFTGKDEYEKLNNGKKTVAERITELQNELNNVLKKQTKYHHLRNTFCLSNTDDPDKEFEKLRLEISALARQMKHWGELMPLKWILLEHLIEINKNEGMNFINFSDMLSMANHSDIQMVNIKDVKAFLHFQTKEGNIIFFDDIQDFIILNPQWLVEAFRCLVSDRMDPKLQHRSDWGDFKDNGRISESLIREFFKSKGGKHFIDQTKDLLKVMEKFDILIKIDETNSYIMPSMMPSGVFHDVCKQIGVEGADCKRTSWLCLKFEFLPPAFFTHFYLWFIRKYKPIYKDNEKPLWKYLFRGFCVFDIDKSNCKKLLVTMSTDTISLQLLSFSATEEDLRSICSDIRAGIIDHTNAITKRYDLKISFELHFKCSKSKFDEESKAYEVLKNMPEYRCENHTHLTKELYLPWMAYEGEPGNPKISRFHEPVGPPGFPGSKEGKGEPARNGVGIKGTKEAPSRDIFLNKPRIRKPAKYKDTKLVAETAVISGMFDKKKIDVEIFVQHPPAPDVDEDERASWNEETADMPTEFVIEVRGMKTTTSEETIRYYFESRRVADADVVKMEFIDEKGIYMIWFEEEKAIEAVMSKSRLQVDGQIINVNRHVPPPPQRLVPRNDREKIIKCYEPDVILVGNSINGYKEKIIEDTLIKDLSEEQEAQIMKLEETCEVEIDINKRIGRIKVRGLIENLSEVMDEVFKILRDIDRQKQKQQHAELVADMVQWYFISVEDTGTKLEEYPAEVNLLLEQAFNNNEPQAFFLNNSGNKYIVDFTNCEEYPEDDPSNTVAVLRKSKMTGSGFDMPSNWAPMDQNENIKIVTLQPADKEYQDVVKDFQTNMAGNYNSIIKIEKIQNRTLQQQYVAKKKLMDSTNTPGINNERNLWHGTAMEAVDSINIFGFNISYCGKNAVAYGNGVYFAVNPTFSAQAQYARPDPNGNKRMYMCKVLVGEFTKGQVGMKVPPPKPGAAGGHISYDSVVDNPGSPGIFVIFHDTQAYPEYLIVFK